jgi:hypothetical protein
MLPKEGYEKNATRMVVVTFGILAAVEGFLHGIGEMLQGNMAPSSVLIQAWPESPLTRLIGGWSAVTIVPNLFLSGALTIILSLSIYALSLFVWATLFVSRKHDGPLPGIVLLILSIVLLLVGGGISAPVIGITVGAAWIVINAKWGWTSKLLYFSSQHFRPEWWLGSFISILVFWLSVILGSVIAGIFTNVILSVNVVVFVLLVALGLLVLAIVTGFAYDVERGGDSHQKPNESG